MRLDRFLHVRLLVALVVFQIRVDRPDLGMYPVQCFGMGLIERHNTLKDPVGMDPAQCMGEDVELSGIITNDN